VKQIIKFGVLFALVSLISGCKVPLYHNLNENEANQMLSLLINHGIDVSKQVDGKSDSVQLLVEEGELSKAISILTSNGYPKKTFQKITDVFPSGQIVTSKEEQEAKLNFINEQNLASMLLQIPGVINSRVQINQPISSDIDLGSKKPPTVSALVIYSSNYPVRSHLIDIRELIKNSISNLSDQNLSVVMIPEEQQSLAHTHLNASNKTNLLSSSQPGLQWLQQIFNNKPTYAVATTVLLLLLISTLIATLVPRRFFSLRRKKLLTAIKKSRVRG